MRLGLFGGSFDPVHYGPLLLAECGREQCRLDQVVFLPAAVPPHKQGVRATPAEHRVAMLELATAALSPTWEQKVLTVSCYEIERGGVNYTIDTLDHFRRSYPQAELFFLMGADMFYDLPNWREAARVCQTAIPVVVGRAGFAPIDFKCLAPIATAERIEAIRRCRVEMPAVEISSTDIRRRVLQGQSIRYRTPLAVERYIRERGLYRSEGLGIRD